jgi:hypothetical protein
MISACNDFLSDHGEDIEKYFYNGHFVEDDLTYSFCMQKRLCENLWNLSEKPSITPLKPLPTNEYTGVATAILTNKKKAETKTETKADEQKVEL